MRTVVITGLTSDADRTLCAQELGARGLAIADGPSTRDDIVVTFDEDAVRVCGPAVEPGVKLSRAIALADLAAFVRVAADLSDIHRRLLEIASADASGILASLVAHDANNALAPMRLAADQLVELGPPHVSELAESIVGGCRQLESMMRHLAPKSGSLTLARVDVNTIVGLLGGMLQALAGPHVHVVTHLESPLPATLVDPFGLERALLNLVANARDAMPGGGQVVLSTSTVRISPDEVRGLPHGRWILVQLKDHGVGMAPEVLARAFEPFFTTKEAGRGTGLGLPSVRRTMRAARGEVLLQSQPGKGTVVQLWLPALPD
jgi:signal transduction histidine kinase